jgi:hypothetical protein
MGVVAVARGKASALGLMLNKVNKVLKKHSMKLIAIPFAQRFMLVISQYMPVLLIG